MVFLGMNLRFPAWLLLFLFPGWLQAQAPDVGWLNMGNTLKGAYQHKVLAADLQGYYVYQSSGRERSIDKYSYAGNLVYSHKIPLDDRSIEIEELLVRRQDVLVFFSIYNPSLRRHGLFYMRIPHQGEASKPTILLDMDNVNNRARSFFYLTPNEDLSGFSAVHQDQPRPDELRLEMAFFNDSCQLTNSTRLLLPQTEARLELKGLVQDKNHHLFLLLQQFRKERKGPETERLSYSLLRIDQRDMQADELRLGSSVYYLNELQIGYDRANHRVRLAGFYNEKDRGPLQGVVVAQVQPDSMRFDTIGYSRFDPEFTQKLYSYKANKKEKELTDYFLGDLIMRSDGGVVLLAESNYQTNQTYVQYSQGFPIYREVVYYHYDEVVMVSVNPNGSIDWRQIIPKTQTSVTPSPYFSYSAFPVGPYVHVLFNEESRSKNSVMLYSVSNTGQVVPRNVLTGDINDALIIPADAKVISPTTILLPASRRKKKGIFRLTFGQA